MSNAAQLELLDPGALTWPVLYRWYVDTWWGGTSQELAVDVPMLAGNSEATGALGPLLWKAIVAPATSAGVRLYACDFSLLYGINFPRPVMMEPAYGNLVGDPSSREEAGCLMMHSGHHDPYSMRPLYFPGVPTRLIEGRLLTDVGARALESIGHRMVSGLMSHILGGPMSLLVVSKGVVTGDPFNPLGYGVRRCSYIRVCHHTERAPDITA